MREAGYRFLIDPAASVFFAAFRKHGLNSFLFLFVASNFSFASISNHCRQARANVGAVKSSKNNVLATDSILVRLRLAWFCWSEIRMVFFLPLASPSVLFIQNQSGTSKLCTLSMLATAVVVVMHVVSLYYYSTLSDSLMFVRGRVTSVALRQQRLQTQLYGGHTPAHKH